MEKIKVPSDILAPLSKIKKKVSITFVVHFEQTWRVQSSHLHPRLKNPNLVFMHRKQTLPFSTSSFRFPSKGRPSSSAFVKTDLICTISSKFRSKVCKAVVQWSWNIEKTSIIFASKKDQLMCKKIKQYHLRPKSALFIKWSFKEISTVQYYCSNEWSYV